MSLVGVLVVTVLSMPPFVVNYKGQWHVFSRDGRYLRRLENFAGQTPNAVTIGPNGKSLAFTTGSSLYYAEDDVTPPRKLGPASGYFSDPAFDIAGESIYFVHNAGPEAGPIGFHGSGVNAQLWKVTIVSGASEQLTSTHGCKRQPEPQQSGEIYLIHSTCDGKSSIEKLGVVPETLLDAGYDNLEVHVSPDEKRVAWFRRVFNGAELLIGPREKPAQATIVRKLAGEYPRLDLAWSATGRSIYYQSYGHLVAVDANSKTVKNIYNFKLRRAE